MAAPRRRRITVRDIARRMKVNVSTVSRALAGSPGVSEERAAEIRRLAEKLGYCPHPMRRKRTGAVGLVVYADGGTDRPGAPDAEYAQRIIYWTERCAAERDLHVNVEFAARLPARPAASSPRRGRTGTRCGLVRANRVDGVLLAGHLPTAFCRELALSGIPAVALNDTRRRTGCDSVTADVGPALEEAMGRLISLGHRDVGLVISRREYPTVEARYATYCRMMKKSGLGPDPSRILEGLEFNLRGGRESVGIFLRRGDLPTAVVYENDWMALGAMYELARHGRSVPADVSLVSHDDTRICEEVSPALTSVDGSEAELVSTALDRLLGRIAGEYDGPEDIAVPTRLVWRESCAAPGDMR